MTPHRPIGPSSPESRATVAGPAHATRVRRVARGAAPRVAALLFAGVLAAPAIAVTPPKPGSAPPAVGTPAPSAKAAAKGAGQAEKVLELDWEELVPQDLRSRIGGGPPPPVHDYLGEGGMAAAQPLDFSVNKELDGVNVRIPGFIVPLDVGKDGLVSEFFLVPYFGACIHVPPPPPNQIVYVKTSKGLALESIYEAYWVTGKMAISRKNTQLGAAAYALAASKVEIYKY